MNSVAPASIAELRNLARRRLPPPIFDFLEGGCGSEYAIRRNVKVWRNFYFNPQVLVDVRTRAQNVRLFDIEYASPFGIAPVGLADLIWPGAEAALTEAATALNIPYVISSASMGSVERTCRIARPNNIWLQLYATGIGSSADDIVALGHKFNIPVLVLTVDAPALARRLRDIKNRLMVPVSPLFLARNALGHPRWTFDTLMKHAGYRFSKESAKGDVLAGRPVLLRDLQKSHLYAGLDWDFLARLRKRWPGRIVLKGVLNLKDALKAASCGVDGIVISNHGGRQLDGAAPAVNALEIIRSQLKGNVSLILDGGIRSGEDVAKAIALGADFVLLGRAFLYGIGALGPSKGPRMVYSIISDELDAAQAQLGCTSISQISRCSIWDNKAPSGLEEGLYEPLGNGW